MFFAAPKQSDNIMLACVSTDFLLPSTGVFRERERTVPFYFLRAGDVCDLRSTTERRQRREYVARINSVIIRTLQAEAFAPGQPPGIVQELTRYGYPGTEHLGDVRFSSGTA